MTNNTIYEFPEPAIREVIASIRLRDERADSTTWKWSEMDQGRQELVIGDLLESLSPVERDDLMTDVFYDRSLWLYKITMHNPIRSRLVRLLTPWFEEVIEPRVNERVAA